MPKPTYSPTEFAENALNSANKNISRLSDIRVGPTDAIRVAGVQAEMAKASALVALNQTLARLVDHLSTETPEQR